ncbi:response regulator [Ekhidna sp.]|uniref:hybrid sensor histidine kinase/response regulator n=1 Tax=Ekhidna sp. TaxID=2608089 RepID=UPI003BAC0E82
MTRILVVDDEPDLEALVKQKFRKNIRNGEYQFFFAENGQKALDLLNETEVDLVLTDINMPEMDGLTLLSKLNETNYFLKTVIVSAYGDMENIRTAMNLGAFDFITKPIDFKDLEITMVKTIKHILQLRENAETLRENDTLKIYLREIKAQKRLKDRFFAIISHDLRGPVSSFQGISQVISLYLQQAKYEDLQKMMSEVDKATDHLSKLLDNLLNWASSELSQIPYNPEKINLSEMIHDVVEIFELIAKSKNITIESEIDPSAVVHVDLNSTVTIFRNLINNALKFTPEGGKVTIKSEQNGAFNKISVHDSGVGINEEQLQTLFILSEKSSTYGTKGEKGIGLGLQLVNEFTKLNKGEVEVTSEVGKGTTFSISLPTKLT